MANTHIGSLPPLTVNNHMHPPTNTCIYFVQSPSLGNKMAQLVMVKACNCGFKTEKRCSLGSQPKSLNTNGIRDPGVRQDRVLSAGAHLLASAGTRAAGEQLRAPPAQGTGHHPEDRVEARLGCQSVGGGQLGWNGVLGNRQGWGHARRGCQGQSIPLVSSGHGSMPSGELQLNSSFTLSILHPPTTPF